MTFQLQDGFLVIHYKEEQEDFNSGGYTSMVEKTFTMSLKDTMSLKQFLSLKLVPYIEEQKKAAVLAAKKRKELLEQEIKQLEYLIKQGE